MSLVGVRMPLLARPTPGSSVAAITGKRTTESEAARRSPRRVHAPPAPDLPAPWSSKAGAEAPVESEPKTRAPPFIPTRQPQSVRSSLGSATVAGDRSATRRRARCLVPASPSGCAARHLRSQRNTANGRGSSVSQIFILRGRPIRLPYCVDLAGVDTTQLPGATGGLRHPASAAARASWCATVRRGTCLRRSRFGGNGA